MTDVGFIIQPGESIPDDVTEVVGALGFALPVHPGDAAIQRLTVTAVREQPAEPEPVDVLDLVRQYGEACASRMASVMDENEGYAEIQQHKATADALFARLEAEVNRLRAEHDSCRYLAAANKLTIERDDARAELKHHLDSVDRLAGERNEALAEVERWRERVLDLLPDPSAPPVLSLPTVPDGAVALQGGARWLPSVEALGFWVMEGGSVPHALGAVLDREAGSVSVVMREPRTTKDNIAELRNWINLAADQKHWEYDEAIYCLDRIEDAIRELVGPVFDDKDSTR